MHRNVTRKGGLNRGEGTGSCPMHDNLTPHFVRLGRNHRRGKEESVVDMIVIAFGETGVEETYVSSFFGLLSKSLWELGQPMKKVGVSH